MNEEERRELAEVINAHTTEIETLAARAPVLDRALRRLIAWLGDQAGEAVESDLRAAAEEHLMSATPEPGRVPKLRAQAALKLAEYISAQVGDARARKRGDQSPPTGD